jgi:hypothetical protein
VGRGVIEEVGKIVNGDRRYERFTSLFFAHNRKPRRDLIMSGF